jgi:uroporphyrin-III C-methyltransferase/precorrin-2 dehydrogenase/sirohydrochlorin ferrochelatase
MRTYPVFLDLRGRRVLVLGDGETATRKAAPLRRAGADVHRAARFAPALLDGAVLAIGADAPEEDLRALSAEAQRRGIPVNVVDRPELCSFISPAVVDRDPLVVAVSSGGAAPVLARLLRARIEALVAPGYARLAALAEEMKQETRRLLPDVTRRRRMLEQVLGGRVAELALAGEADAARAEYRRALRDAAETTAPAAGMVIVVDPGSGEADLLTLRALRLLGEADAVVHGPEVPDAVLDLARRDAPRHAGGMAEAAAMAATGAKVVLVSAAPGPAPEAVAVTRIPAIPHRPLSPGGRGPG